jgi:ABC-type lipoprotein release transport system permease subunit
MRRLLTTFSWQELRHHPWRSAVAVLAVALGVALAFAVQLINASALAEFGQAVAAVNGQPDGELRARQGTLDDALFERVAAHPQVAVASPVLELTGLARPPAREPVSLKLLGVDALVVARVAPALMPVLDDRDTGGDRLDLFAPDAVFLNPAAREALGEGATLALRLGERNATLRVAGSVNAPGPPLAVMDVAALQALAARAGALSRIDLRLASGAVLDRVVADLTLPPQVLVQRPAQAGERVSNLSRAYRVNLTVLALVALFTGAFLVFSVLSLSVTRRQPQLALLAVLGLSARERMRLLLAESALIGAVGSLLGVVLGTALAALALQRLGGDLGGGYFTGVSPPLRWSSWAALLYGALGVTAALVGGWWPARAAAGLAPALALKGLGTAAPPARRHGLALGLVALAGLAALTPPVAGMPLGAYASVGLLLVGGIAALPLAVGALLQRMAPWVVHRALPLLAVERARRVRETAAVGPPRGGGGPPRAPGAPPRGRGHQRGGGQPRAVCGAHRHGGELSGFGDAMARCGSACTAVPAHHGWRPGRHSPATRLRGRCAGVARCDARRHAARRAPAVRRRTPASDVGGAHAARRTVAAPAGGQPDCSASRCRAGVRERGHARPLRRARGPAAACTRTGHGQPRSAGRALRGERRLARLRAPARQHCHRRRYLRTPHARHPRERPRPAPAGRC